MPEVTPLEAAMQNAATAEEEAPTTYEMYKARSWQAFLDHVAQVTPTDPAETEWYREAYNRGRDSVQTPMIDSLVNDITAAVQLLPRVESLEVRADLAQALGHKLEITPEEPDPGRDWSRVRGELFKPSGKWMYSVWLDYTGERKPPESSGYSEPGVGPHGWHFDGGAMARQALANATERGTSGVTMREIPNGWRLFVPDPPQGFPLYAIGSRPDDRPDINVTDDTDLEVKLDEIRQIIEADSYIDRIARIQEVLDR